jgi:hypothetical protein
LRVGEDGAKLADVWWSIAGGPMRRDADRLEASPLLADRGWGKAASFEPLEGDPLDLESAELLRRAVTLPLPVHVQHGLHVVGQGGLKLAFATL